jgi:small subunit ribosomal protein S20
LRSGHVIFFAFFIAHCYLYLRAPEMDRICRGGSPLSTRYHSGIKARRQNAARKAHNKAEVSKIRTRVKKTRLALASGKADEAAQLMPGLYSALDKGVKHGRLHKNTVARRKSRFAKKLAALADTKA